MLQHGAETNDGVRQRREKSPSQVISFPSGNSVPKQLDLVSYLAAPTHEIHGVLHGRRRILVPFLRPSKRGNQARHRDKIPQTFTLLFFIWRFIYDTCLERTAKCRRLWSARFTLCTDGRAVHLGVYRANRKCFPTLRNQRQHHRNQRSAGDAR